MNKACAGLCSVPPSLTDIVKVAGYACILRSAVLLDGIHKIKVPPILPALPSRCST